MPHIIELGTQERLKLLFSYPNTSSSTESLADTLQHWFQQTLERDNLAARGARFTVHVEGPDYSLVLEGPPELDASFRTYQERFPKFLDNGWEAFTHVIPRLMAEKRWDPSPTLEGPKSYRPWRFFLTLGTALVHQRSLQFFHYPPIRLLEECRDYLKDPVPERCEELLRENGVAKEEVHLYESIVDAVPIAAEDDQGSKQSDKGSPLWGLIPIGDFAEYQKAQVRLLLNPAPNNASYTIPIVVYGSHPREIFELLYGVKLPLNSATTVEILPGKKTPVMATSHPYRFYATVQGGDSVGSGEILPDKRQEATELMIRDLTAARWQKLMADDPSRDPQVVLRDCQAYWEDSKQRDRVEALVLRQGSLTYPKDQSLAYTFSVSRTDATSRLAASRLTGAGSLK